MGRRPPKPADRVSQPRTKAKQSKPKGSLAAFAFVQQAVIPQPKTLSLSELTTWPSTAEWRAMFEQASEELQKGTDRAVAILGALYAHDAINSLLLTHMVRRDEPTIKDLTRRDGTLYSFGSATMLAYALGLIDEKTRERLDIIRKVRNAFAHAMRPISFGTTSIADACRTLDYRPTGPLAEALRYPADSVHMTKAERARYEFLQTVFSEGASLAAKAAKKNQSEVRSLNRKLRKIKKALSSRHPPEHR